MMKKVVILGGGFAGSLAAKKLQKDFEVTLIDTKDYFEFTPGILRTIVEPRHIKRVQVLHRHYLKKAHFIKEEVTDILPNEVRTGKKIIPFDYLIIASGSRYNPPIKAKSIILSTRADILRDYHHRLHHSKHILIIGGGLVGIELAAEIVDHYKNKEIVLCEATDKIMGRSTDKVRDYAFTFLTKKGVKFIFNEFVVHTKKDQYVTNKGTKLKTDIAFMCTGIIPNSEFIKPHYPDLLNERNFIKVNSYLQAEGFNRIFVAGDVTNIMEEKTAQNAEKHAEIIIKNIKNLEKKEKLYEYLSKPRIMVISLGKWNGIITYKNFVFTGLFAAFLKQAIEWKTMWRYKLF